MMAEFLLRGWNVAMPEVDIGDDIFVVRDDNSSLRRIQVKTSKTTQHQNSFSAQFNIPISQLNDLRVDSKIYYIFIARHKESWVLPTIIRQDYLKDFCDKGMGSKAKSTLTLYFSYRDGKIKCSNFDISKYIADFTDFPVIKN